MYGLLVSCTWGATVSFLKCSINKVVRYGMESQKGPRKLGSIAVAESMNTELLGSVEEQNDLRTCNVRLKQNKFEKEV